MLTPRVSSDSIAIVFKQHRLKAFFYCYGAEFAKTKIGRLEISEGPINVCVPLS